DVAKAPKSWQLDELGAPGRLTGKARLVAVLKPDGVDLTGSSGHAVIERGAIGGIPFKSLELSMTATGHDLRYEQAGSKSSSTNRRIFRGVGIAHDGSSPEWGAVSTLRRPGFGVIPGIVVAFQSPPTKDAAKSEPPDRPRIQLPKTITTHLEL